MLVCVCVFIQRRNVNAINESHLSQLRQLACQLEESLLELNHEVSGFVRLPSVH